MGCFIASLCFGRFDGKELNDRRDLADRRIKLAVANEDLVGLARFELLARDARHFDRVFENRTGARDGSRVDDVEAALAKKLRSFLADGDELRCAGLFFKKVCSLANKARVV